MDEKNYNWGNDIKNTIQDAIQSGDFSRLSQNVSRSLNDMFRAFGVPTDDDERRRYSRRRQYSNQQYSSSADSRNYNSTSAAGGQQGSSGRQYYSGPQDSPRYNSRGMASDGAANPYSRSEEQSRRFREAYERRAAAQPRRSSRPTTTTGESERPRELWRGREVKKAERRESDRYYLSKNGTRKTGLIMTIAGYASAFLAFASFSISSIIRTISQAIFNQGGGLTVGNIVMLGATAAATVVGTLGVKRLRLSSRFHRYRDIIGDRTYVKVSELAEKTGRKESAVVKDLEEMIERGWFVEGHLDGEKTGLMTSEEMYRQYLETTLQSIQLRKEKEEKEAAEEQIPAEVRDIIHSGAQFIKEIHACNDAIPDETMTAKISRMETIIRQIFIRVERHPEVAPELRKTMNYYLPTTVKLLNAYIDLDNQPIEGENIANSKKEIEDTLDTLNNAYEKLLDSLFKDTAWDVSTDISVIKTLLAQEGLTDTDFVMPKPFGSYSGKEDATNTPVGVHEAAAQAAQGQAAQAVQTAASGGFAQAQAVQTAGGAQAMVMEEKKS